jgi:hypothetical protein
MKRCQEEFERFLEIPEISDYINPPSPSFSKGGLWGFGFILPDRPF